MPLSAPSLTFPLSSPGNGSNAAPVYANAAKTSGLYFGASIVGLAVDGLVSGLTLTDNGDTTTTTALDKVSSNSLLSLALQAFSTFNLPALDGSGVAGQFFYSTFNAPSNALGANGDICFRNGTPGVANQRIYIKSAGAWVGIA